MWRINQNNFNGTLALPEGNTNEDEPYTLATIDSTQTFTNKTIRSPVLNDSVSGTAILDENDMSSN